MATSDHPAVLIVGEEPVAVNTDARWLQSQCEVRVAESGQAALEQLDKTIDVVLLDRMMPRMSSTEVLTEIRDHGSNCRVAMVTAADPDFDIIEMGFDEYITKPPDEEKLRDTVERLIDRSTLNDDLQKYYSLVLKRATLQAEFSTEELKANVQTEYAELVERIESRRNAVDEAMEDMSSDTNFVGAVREITDSDLHSETLSSPGDEGSHDLSK